MGAWIEIYLKTRIDQQKFGRTPRWVRGLKSLCWNKKLTVERRTPRWVRGLKLNY